MASGRDAYVVLVTGGAGFLGQHVVGLLQTRADHVTEIRVLDMVPYVNKLDYEARKPVRQYVGSINDLDLVSKACEGVQCVMHLASKVDVSLLPDKELSHKINVLGTQTVIDACHATGVRRLVYCSTINVVIGKENIYNGTERSTTVTKYPYYPVYGHTKAMAEDLVLRANDSQLQAVSLRPMTLYGELDVHTIKVNITLAKQFGSYPRVSCGKGKMQMAYAGNVAWAFICTDKGLHEANTNNIAGNAFFISDDTPPESMNEILDPMLTEAGYKPFPFVIPQWMIFYPLYLLYLILSLISIVYRVNATYGVESVVFLTKIYLFSHEKASQVIGYRPLYTNEEAKARTVKYMKSFKSET